MSIATGARRAGIPVERNNAVVHEQLLQLLDILPEAYLLVQGDGTVIAASSAVEVRLGIARESLHGRRLVEVVAEPGGVADYLRACARTRSLLPGSLVLTRKDGTLLPCRAEGALFQPASADGSALLLIRLLPKELAVRQLLSLNQQIDKLSREILKRRQVEQSLREQGEWLRTVLASIGDAVIATDTRGQVTFMNAVAEALTGWPRQEALEQPLQQVFRIVNEQTRQPMQDPVQQVLRDGQVVGLANHTLLLGRDGAERIIDDSAAPIRDEAGAIGGVVLVFHDETTSRLAQKSLRESEERFRQLAENISDVFWIAEPNLRRILYVSPAYEAIWGRPSRTLLERPETFLDALHPDDRPGFLTALEREAKGEAVVREYRILRPDGTVRWIFDRGFPIRDDSGAVYRVAGIAEDITQRKEVEQSLRESSRRKDEMLAMLAHELRNPLAPIRTATEVFRLLAGDNARLRKAADLIERQVEHLVRLVDDLLDVSRLIHGRIVLRKEPHELSAIVTRAVETSRPLLDTRRQQLTVELPTEPVLVEGDATRLIQVVSNLLNNAAKYTDEGGHVRVALERHGALAHVAVRDTGMGIPAGLLPHIFDLFTQGDRALARTEGGLGIGLTVVKSLVELHGGTVQAFSDGPGKGTEIVVRLPLLTIREDLPGTASRTKPRPVQHTSQRLLIVDDNHDAADSLALLLHLHGHDVRTAYDGASALEMAQAFRPQAVVLDIGLPHMDGYEVARRLRQHAELNKVLLIALTGYGQDEDRRRAEEAGFDAHLVKPPDIEELHRLLARLGEAD